MTSAHRSRRRSMRSGVRKTRRDSYGSRRVGTRDGPGPLRHQSPTVPAALAPRPLAAREIRRRRGRTLVRGCHGARPIEPQARAVERATGQGRTRTQRASGRGEGTCSGSASAPTRMLRTGQGSGRGDHHHDTATQHGPRSRNAAGAAVDHAGPRRALEPVTQCYRATVKRPFAQVRPACEQELDNGSPPRFRVAHRASMRHRVRAR